MRQVKTLKISEFEISEICDIYAYSHRHCHSYVTTTVITIAMLLVLKLCGDDVIGNSQYDQDFHAIRGNYQCTDFIKMSLSHGRSD
jgi:hypothetical protein